MTLGADLVMLAVNERHGTLDATRQLAFALAGAELVDLAQWQRIGATVDARVEVTEPLGTGDPVLDATLGMLSAGDEGGRHIEDIVAMYMPDRVARQANALISSGEMAGRATALQVGGATVFSNLRPPQRRRVLIEQLADADAWEQDLVREAFGALAHIAGLSSFVLGRGHRGARRRLKALADRFQDTWRYLPPGCPPELELGHSDLAPGRVHPADEQPWRLAVLLAVQEAGKRVAALPKPPGGSGVGADRGLENAINLSWALEYGG